MGGLAAGVGLSALGGIVAGNQNRSGISNAQRMQNQGIEQGMEQLRAAQEQAQQTLSPWSQGGLGAFNQLTAPGGIQSVQPTMTGFNLQQFMNDPVYQFQLAQGNQAINQAAAARGKYFAPQTIQQLQQFGQGLAGQEYGNAFNRYLQQSQGLFNQNLASNQNLYNQLFGLANIGQSVASQQAQGQSNLGANLASLLGQRGQVNANAAMQQAQNRANLYGGLLNMGGQFASLGSIGGIGGIGGAGAMNLPTVNYTPGSMVPSFRLG